MSEANKTADPAPVQSCVHVYCPSSLLGRAVRKCTTCRCRRRFIVRVFGWYASRWTCGGCGVDRYGRIGHELRPRRYLASIVHLFWLLWVSVAWIGLGILDGVHRIADECKRSRRQAGDLLSSEISSVADRIVAEANETIRKQQEGR